MSIRTKFALFSGRVTKNLLKRLTGGGSSLPGKVALKISPNILTDVAKDYDVIIITGTNGKTLTTSLISNIFSRKYDNIVTNRQGSNMFQGIVGAFLGKKKKSKEKGIAILEVDEGTLNRVIEPLNPKHIIHTNIFLDQTDRYGDVTKTYELLVRAANKVPNAHVLQNGDLPIFNTVSLKNKRTFFGFDTPVHQPESHNCPICNGHLTYRTYTFSGQGDYTCPSCGLKRPDLTYKVTDIQSMTEGSNTFSIDHETFTIPVAGLYNIYNALAAYSIAKEYNINNDIIKAAFLETERVFGRQEIIPLGNHQAMLNVVKNPVGLNQVIDLIKQNKDPIMLVALLNNRPADGVDMSWLKDGNFEALLTSNIAEIKTGGIRASTMTSRLTSAGFSEALITQYDDLEQIVEDLEETNIKNIQIIASYTAMLEFRKILKDKGHL